MYCTEEEEAVREEVEEAGELESELSSSNDFASLLGTLFPAEEDTLLFPESNEVE